MPVPVVVQPLPVKEDIGDNQLGLDDSIPLSIPLSVPVVTKVENPSISFTPENDMEISESPMINVSDQQTTEENFKLLDEATEDEPGLAVNTTEVEQSPVRIVDHVSVAPQQLDLTPMEGLDASYELESDEDSTVISISSASEETSHDLPQVLSCIELTEDQQSRVSKLAVERIIESSKHIQTVGCSQTCMALLARLVLQVEVMMCLILILCHHRRYIYCVFVPLSQSGFKFLMPCPCSHAFLIICSNLVI